MTFEKRCTVEASDILAISFECGGCGSAFRVPAEKLATSHMPTLVSDCVHCHAPSGFKNGTAEYDHLAAFVAGVANLAKTMAGRNLHVKLELRCADVERKP
jgi:hypothetical protein